MRQASHVSTAVAHLVGPGKLKIINGHFAFVAREKRPFRLVPGDLRLVICYGKIGITDEAFDVLFNHEIEVAWLSPAGQKYRGRLLHPRAKSQFLRLAQLAAMSNPDCCLPWAVQLVAAKIQSQWDAVRHFQRHGVTSNGLLEQLRDAVEQCEHADSLDQLRGVEGAASAAWFRFFGKLVKAPWSFQNRNRRPPKDPMNALLSLGYTWLLTRALAAAAIEGLDVNLGGLHAFRPGRPSLACDLIEPLRVPAVDRWALTVVNKNSLAPEDFIPDSAIGFRLKSEQFGRTLISWENHWENADLNTTLGKSVKQFKSTVRQHAVLFNIDNTG